MAKEEEETNGQGRAGQGKAARQQGSKARQGKEPHDTPREKDEMPWTTLNRQRGRGRTEGATRKELTIPIRTVEEYGTESCSPVRASPDPDLDRDRDLVLDVVVVDVVGRVSVCQPASQPCNAFLVSGGGGTVVVVASGPGSGAGLDRSLPHVALDPASGRAALGVENRDPIQEPLAPRNGPRAAAAVDWPTRRVSKSPPSHQPREGEPGEQEGGQERPKTRRKRKERDLRNAGILPRNGDD